MNASEEIDRTSPLSAVRTKWRVVTPPDAHWYGVPHTPHGRARLAATLNTLPAHAPVVLCDAWPLSRTRCRKVALRGAVTINREYVALPTLSRAVALMQDEDGTSCYLATNLLVAPLTTSVRSGFQNMMMPVGSRIVRSRLRPLVFGGRMLLGARA